jgi:hypothetical protein
VYSSNDRAHLLPIAQQRAAAAVSAGARKAMRGPPPFVGISV